MHWLDLPIEIVHIILRLAVHVEGALVSSLSPDDSHIQWLRWQYHENQRYKQSMTTKRSLLLVCKAWFSIAVEILYEDIRIDTATEIICLHQALSASQDDPVLRGASTGTRHVGYGWWTKRFDLLPESTVAAQACFTLFPAVVTYMPNLTILKTFPLSFNIPALLKSSLPCLRYASVRSDDPLHFPHVRSLFLHLTRRGLDHIYPNLTFLEVCPTRPITAPNALSGECYFPQLRHFGVRHIPNAAMERSIATFLERHGLQLVSLALKSFSKVAVINSFLLLTTHIKELVLCSRLRWEELRCEAPVARLGLFHLSGVVDLTGLAFAQVPNLEIIQLVDTAADELFSFSDEPSTEIKCVELSCPELRDKVKVEDVYGSHIINAFKCKAPGRFRS